MANIIIDKGESVSFAFEINGIDIDDLQDFQVYVGDWKYTLSNSTIERYLDNERLFYVRVNSNVTIQSTGFKKISIALATDFLGVQKQTEVGTLKVNETNQRTYLDEVSEFISATFVIDINADTVTSNAILENIYRGAQGADGVDGTDGVDGVVEYKDENNLYNPDNTVIGKEISTSNVEVDRPSEAYTVVNIDKQVISVSGLPSGATFARYYIFLNASNVVTGTGFIATANNSATINVPANSTVFKINLTGRNASGLSNLGNVRIENGNKINAINEKVFKINDKELLINEVLPTQGLETIVFGDSITETLTSGNVHKTNWISYTQDYLNFTFTNYARSGARVRGLYTLNDRAKLATQVSDAISEKGSTDVKIVIFNIMTNDTDSSANTSDFATAIAKTLITDLDLTQFADALRHAFWSASLQWSNAKIYACTPLRRVNGYNETNTNTQMGILRQMANFYNIKIIDQFNEVGISPQFEVNGGAGRYLSDGLHPNETGKKKQGLFIANEIIKDFKFKTLY